MTKGCHWIVTSTLGHVCWHWSSSPLPTMTLNGEVTVVVRPTDITTPWCTKLCVLPSSINMLTGWPRIYPCIRNVSGTTCPNNALKLNCASGGSGTISGRVSYWSCGSGTSSLSSIMSRNKEEEHLWPREYFSSHWKHSPFSLRIASSSGVRRLKGTVDEFMCVGVGNKGVVVEGIGVGCWRKLGDAPVEGRNSFAHRFVSPHVTWRRPLLDLWWLVAWLELLGESRVSSPIWNSLKPWEQVNQWFG